MTGTPEELRARARAAYQRTIDSRPFVGPMHPDALAKLEAAITAMGRIDREIFLAHRIDGMTYIEIAAKTGRSEREIERRMSQAMGVLMRHLDGRPVRRSRLWRFK